MAVALAQSFPHQRDRSRRRRQHRRNVWRRRMRIVRRDVTVRELDLAEVPLLNGLDRTGIFWGEWLVDAAARGLPAVRIEPDKPIPVPDWSHPEMLHRYDLWRQRWSATAALLGAFYRGRLLGFALLGPVERKQPVELFCLFVDTPFRRCGVGSELLVACQRRCRQQRATQITAYSTFGDGGMSFYLRHGFRMAASGHPPGVHHPLRADQVRLVRKLR